MDITYKSNQNIVKLESRDLLTLQIKDFWSAATHGIGALAAFCAVPFLIDKYLDSGADLLTLISMFIFGLSMVLLYTASTIYHTYVGSKHVEFILKKIDHMMIFVLIAGTYTPICLTILRDTCGYYLLLAIWSLAFIGMILKFCWVTCPKWFSSSIYIGMGWLCIFAMPDIYKNLNSVGFSLLFIGGIIYTLGGIIYALKLPVFNSNHKYFGSHEIFHIFVMLGNLCHFIMIYKFL